MSDPISVAIVDDDPLVRSSLTMMLGGDPDLCVIGEAANGLEAIDLISREVPDVALMDIRMPVMDGLAALRALVAKQVQTRIIVLTTFDDDESVLTALGDGAAGFLLKHTPPADLVESVHRVAQGAPMLSPSITSRVIAAATNKSAPARESGKLIASLTEREREVAGAVARGLSNAEIAEDLFMAVPTVKTHVGRLFEKLGVTNRVQLARLAHEAGLD